jgi:M6 family metalloprotease-like protein
VYRSEVARWKAVRAAVIAVVLASTATVAASGTPASAAATVQIMPTAQCHGARCFVEVRFGATSGATTATVQAGTRTRVVTVGPRRSTRIVDLPAAALNGPVSVTVDGATTRRTVSRAEFDVNRPAQRCATLAPTNEWMSVGPPSAVDRSINLPSRGTVRAAVLTVDFPDAVGQGNPRATTLDWIARETPHMQRSSYGRFDLEVVESTTGWVRMPAPLSSYGLLDGATYEEHWVYIQDAIDAADAQIDFTDVQLTIVVIPQTAFLFGSLAFRGLASSLVTGEGQRNAAVTFGSDAIGTDGVVFSHEVLHTLGLPDLYSYGGSDIHAYVGNWDYMGNIYTSPTDLFAWQRTQLRWLEPRQTLCGRASGRTVARLAPLGTRGGTKAVFIRTGRHTGLVVENRQPVGNDRNICRSGALVYSLDSRRATGLGPIRVEGSTADCGIGERSGAPLRVGQSLTVKGVTVSVLGEGNGTIEVAVVAR